MAHFNLFSILMTSQLSSIIVCFRLASLRMPVSAAKDQTWKSLPENA